MKKPTGRRCAASLTAATLLSCLATLSAIAEPKPGDADYPTKNDNPRHAQKVEAVKTGNYDLVLIGDSITHTLGELNDGKYAPNQAVWNRHFAPRHAINLGMNGQRTEEILWNLQNGELDFAKSPKVVMLLIGTNNSDDRHFKRVHTPEEILAGTKAIVELIRHRHPATKILVLRIFPRGGDDEKSVSPPDFNSSEQCIEICRRAGELTKQLADDQHVFWLDVNSVFMRPDGTINTDLMWDLLHPSPAGAEAWVQAVEPTLARLMGDQPIIGKPAAAGKSAKEDLTKTSYNLGPTGALGWMQVDHGMTENSRRILITAVEKGSPAEGKLEIGDIILGVFGKRFDDDARKCFGRAIGQAETEAARGILPLTVKRDGRVLNVEIKLQVMGSYSDTSPYDCPKTKKILEQGLAVLARNPDKDNGLHTNDLALLAGGRPEDLATVTKSARKLAAATPEVEALWKDSSKGGMRTWHHGYNNLFLCEYYLATGDKSVLPAIRAYTTSIARGQGMFGTWGHGYVPPDSNGKLHGPVPPYGPVNATGLPCFISMVLAEKCGIADPELKPAIERASRFFGYYVGKGFIPYGEHRPGIGHDDNGKTSMAAMAFALQEKQPETRFFAKMVTASYESREWGHTGNGFSYLWGPVAANCGGPQAMAAFMKELRWYYDLARRWDGSFVNVGTGGGVASSYHGILGATGSYMLGYAAPLKKIYLTGRAAKPDGWLGKEDIAEAIAAERWLGDNAHAKRTTAQLLAGLGSWSPLDRARSAEELGKRKDDVLPQLLELIKSGSPNARLGAVAAIGQLKGRAAPALDTLASLLGDDDRWLRVQTAEALRNLGAEAKPVTPQMLKAATVRDETDQMQFGVGALAYALFYPGGASGPSGVLAKSIADVPKDQLYPAIRSVAANPDSAARGCLRSTYSLLTLDDVKALAPTIVTSIEEMPPANTMFSKGVRLAGIQALARLRIEEGIPLSLMLMNLKDWGKAYIIETSIDVLKQYRGAAKPILPGLRQLETEIRNTKKEHDKLVDLIKLIEDDTNPPKLITIKESLKRGDTNAKKP